VYFWLIDEPEIHMDRSSIIWRFNKIMDNGFEQTILQGLTKQEVRKGLATDGNNNLPGTKKRAFFHILHEVVDRAHDPDVDRLRASLPVPGQPGSSGEAEVKENFHDRQ
jgi:hypothetical protein